MLFHQPRRPGHTGRASEHIGVTPEHLRATPEHIDVTLEHDGSSREVIGASRWLHGVNETLDAFSREDHGASTLLNRIFSCSRCPKWFVHMDRRITSLIFAIDQRELAIAPSLFLIAPWEQAIAPIVFCRGPWERASQPLLLVLLQQLLASRCSLLSCADIFPLGNHLPFPALARERQKNASLMARGALLVSSLNRGTRRRTPLALTEGARHAERR